MSRQNSTTGGGGQEVEKTVHWGEQPVKVKAPYFGYLGHFMVAPHCRGNAIEDFSEPWGS